MYLPEGGQLIRLPNGQMQVITPTHTQVQQPTNQGLILVSRSNQQVKKTKVIICTNIYGDFYFQIFSQIFEMVQLETVPSKHTSVLSVYLLGTRSSVFSKFYF